jgi:hypothetical protein
VAAAGVREPGPAAAAVDRAAYTFCVLYRLGSNTAVRIAGGRIELEKLGPEPEPPGTQAVRDAVTAMLPSVDYPELILEVNARTGMLDAFTHITGTDARVEDLDISPWPGCWSPRAATSAGRRLSRRGSRR